jgi:hypothetical protein
VTNGFYPFRLIVQIVSEDHHHLLFFSALHCKKKQVLLTCQHFLLEWSTSCIEPTIVIIRAFYKTQHITTAFVDLSLTNNLNLINKLYLTNVVRTCLLYY